MELCIKRAAVRARSPVDARAAGLKRWRWTRGEALIRARPIPVLRFKEQRGFVRALGEGWRRGGRPAGAGIPVELDRRVNGVVVPWRFAVFQSILLMITILAAGILDLLRFPSVFRLAKGSAGGGVALIGPARVLAAAGVPMTVALTRRVRAGSSVRFDQGCGGFAFWKRGAHTDTHKLVKFYSSVRYRSRKLEYSNVSLGGWEPHRWKQSEGLYRAREHRTGRSRGVFRSLVTPLSARYHKNSASESLSLYLSLSLSHTHRGWKLRQTASRNHWRIKGSQNINDCVTWGEFNTVKRGKHDIDNKWWECYKQFFFLHVLGYI